MTTEPQRLDALGLLLTNKEWRQRLVEQVQPVSPDHYVLRRSFQFEIPQRFLDAARITAESSHSLIVPVAWMPKRPLLDFDVTDASGKPLIVLERRSIAGAVASILEAWRKALTEGGVNGSASLLDAAVVESICHASLVPWQTELENAKRSGSTEEDALGRYLNENEVLAFRVPPEDYLGAIQSGRDLADRFSRVVGSERVAAELDSPLTNPWLLLPYLSDLPRSRDVLRATTSTLKNDVEQLLAAVSASGDVLGWVSLLERSAVQWPLLVLMDVQIGVPFTVKTAELRPSGEKAHNIFLHRADLTAARSYHLQVRSPHPDAILKSTPIAFRSDGAQVGSPVPFEQARLTEEIFSTYTSKPDRPQWADFRITFGLRTGARLAYAYAIALVTVGLVAGFMMPVDATTGAVLTIPTTLASAYLLATDTSLVAGLRRWWRRSLVSFSLLLWVTVLFKMARAGSALQWW